MKRKAIVIAVLFALCLTPKLLPPATAAERVMIGTPSRGLFEFPVVVALRKGFFKDEGLNADKVQMQPAIGVKALVSGDIKSGKDLKCKTIGVDSFAGTVDYLARVTVRHFGLEPDKDVKIIVSGESPVRLAAIKAGAIDATAIDVAFAVKAEEEGMRRLLNLADIIDLPLSGIGLTDKKLQTDREQIKKVVRATI